MKSRLGASIFQMFAGERSRSSVYKTKFCLFHAEGQSNRYLLQRFESLKRSVHSFSDEEDDFSELGPPEVQGTGTLLKLATAKPEPFMKHDPPRKATTGKSVPTGSSPSVKDIFQSLSKPSPALHPKLEKHNDISRFPGNSKRASNLKNSCSVSIENVPSIVKLFELIEAISIYGKISCASMRTEPSGLDCCDIEFENVESRRRAVSVGGIMVRSFHLRIRPLFVPETVTIRINRISKETADPVIHSMCKSIGALEGLARAREDAVDAFFSLKDDADMQSILQKLNNTIIDDCRWVAYPQKGKSSAVVMSKNEDAKHELGLQISDRLAELKRQFHMKRIYSEDLQNLHLSIIHLEGQPTLSNTSDMD